MQLYAALKKTAEHAHQQSYYPDDRRKPIPWPVDYIGRGNFGSDTVHGGVGGQYPFADCNFYVQIPGKNGASFRRLGGMQT